MSRVLREVRIDRNIQKYKDEIIKVSFDGYQKEMSVLKMTSDKSTADYEAFMNDKINSMNGLVYLEGSKFCGYMMYYEWEEHDGVHCRIPEWGLGAGRDNCEKVIAYLFQVLAEEKVKEKTIHFSVELYAHDIETQRLFSYMEFGIQAETGVCALENFECFAGTDVRIISKEELEKRWSEAWQLVEQLVNHLKKSPVFYFGEELTEEVYREFFMDEGTNIAKELLFYAMQELKKNHYSYAWVEHGTANPNARYFWNKYFTTYKYEMVRRVGR